MLTPTDKAAKAAIEGLLKAIESLDNEDFDFTPHLKLAARDAVPALQRLLAGETREADGCPIAGDWRVTDWSICLGTIRIANVDFDTMPDPATPERIKLLEWMQRRLNSSPSPHDDAGADKPAGVPDAIKGYEQYPFAWHFGNIKVVLETMECTGKLPKGCPNCRGLSFCTKRDALKRYAKMEQCWNFWMEDPHHG